MTPLWKSLPVRWSSWRKFASRSNGSADLDLELARSWLKDLHPNTIPRHIAQLSFSRSSGPGGQNVNKSVQPRDPLLLFLPPLLVTCSLLPVLRAPSSVLATLKIPLVALLPLVPSLLHPQLRGSRYATDRSQALVIQSDESRQQSSNVEACFDKLHQLLLSSAKQVIPGETSQEQSVRVHKLQRAQNEARLKSKKFASNKKSNRRGSKYDD
ncbi:hypothetical protein N7509_008651 [Penicillium cosmopolitanum]|uniref:Prokaryotic-type class I peptide chain release factors domain-containing protein n=1 Tax=Penicillium cosmopolitanum TaxID=1131564 RepID=A0A9W9VN24_9EURO|nr:uncharacterized protein N7509_008651 [Penicillium cosmopolitanum]KAJ5386110.1 hypothetical protein N7509_008651 [Penicillium cosmopolitanum]